MNASDNPRCLGRRLPCLLFAALAVAGAAPMQAATRDATPRQRLIVLTDIEADPDDTQSMVRLLLYSNVIDLEGLIATTSTHKRTSVAPDSIRAVISTYGKVHGNLLKHSPDYPAPAALMALVRKGRAEYGMGGVGDGKDTEGSDWIIRRLEADDARPLWISVWGGANTLAQALRTLRATRSPARVAQLVNKLRVYSISDQDDAGPWLRKEFPSLFYIASPGGDYAAATWTGINTFIPGIDNTTISNKWIAEHIQQGHGPMGAAYPDVSWGVEGDTPSWLALIPNGLSVPEHPEWGGWGGRYELYLPDVPIGDPRTFIGGVPIPAETRPIWTNAFDEYSPPQFPEYGRASRNGDKPIRDFKATLWRWRDDFQNDFAARMEWTTKSFGEANHPPVPTLGHPGILTVKSGQGFGLDARLSTDPDGDSLSYLWSVYPEAGTYRGAFRISGAENSASVWVEAPKLEAPQTIHFIVRVSDKGKPPLTRYQRVIVTVVP